MSYVAILWLFSIGIATLTFGAAPQSIVIYCIIASAIVQTSHQISPIALAWSNAGFRKLMLVQPAKYLALPTMAVALAVMLPFQWVSVVYWTWNAYHYGMQNFGVLSLCRKPKRRWLAMSTCLLITSAPMLLLFLWHPSWRWLFVFASAMSFNHWIVDIGLSSRAAQWRWLFLVGILLIGSVGFVWYEPTAHGFHRRSDELLQVAMAVGFVHFLYSRWVWRLSDPVVRETIGVNLFRPVVRAKRKELVVVSP